MLQIEEDGIRVPTRNQIKYFLKNVNKFQKIEAEATNFFLIQNRSKAISNTKPSWQWVF